MSLDPMEAKSSRPVQWVQLRDNATAILSGATCPGCGKGHEPLYTGLAAIKEPNEWICASCAAPIPEDAAHTPLYPDDEGIVRVYSTINGAVHSNPFLNPMGTLFGSKREAKDLDDAWVEAGYTDLGNSKRLVIAHGDKFRYVSQFNGFLVYDGFRWKRDETNAMERFAKNTVEAMTQSVSLLDLENEDAQKFLKHVHASCSKGRIEAMIQLSRSDPKIAMVPEQFDRADHLLNCRNGVVNLADGTMMEPEPTDYFTKICNAEYHPDAEAPQWNAFLDTLCHGDDELVDWLQKAVGYTLTGHTSEQVFFFLYGDGANGKTTFLEVIKDIFGDNATTLSFEAFLRNTRINVEHAMSTLVGARMATASEAPEGRAWNEELIKAVTGTEAIHASRKYENGFEFIPKVKIWFAANDQPTVTGVNDGIWRRFCPIPCRSHIDEKDRDGQLPKKLREEASGILAWAVRGAQRWFDEGLKPFPSIIQNSLKEYQSSTDILGRFMQEYCDVAPKPMEAGAQFETPLSELLKAYNQWAKDNNERAQTANFLSRRLAKFRGGHLVKDRDVRGCIMYRGVRVVKDQQGYFE